jgi:regulator of replication initiation timing
MTTSTDLRREFIKLLESDVEFRYTVAGYLGLSEILRSIERLWEEVKGLREEVRKLWENQNKLWEEVRALRENQNKLWEEVRALREGQNKLWENVSKLWEEVRALREDQGRLWREVRDLRVLVERLTLTAEDEGRYVIEWRLGRELGVSVSLSRFFIDDVEINIFGVTDDLVVIGEATVRLGTSLIDELERKVRLVFERRPDLIRPKLIKVIYCDVALPQALKLAEERGIWVLDIRSDLTPRRIHVLK